jgi:hypothetical protein
VSRVTVLSEIFCLESASANACGVYSRQHLLQTVADG